MRTSYPRGGLCICAICIVLLSCSGCGSSNTSSYEQQVSAVGSIFDHYNAARPRNLTQMAQVCLQSGAEMDSADVWNDFSSPSYRTTRQSRALRNTVLAAHTAFHDCASGASTLDYGLMVRAVTEMRSADRWIVLARAAHR